MFGLWNSNSRDDLRGWSPGGGGGGGGPAGGPTSSTARDLDYQMALQNRSQSMIRSILEAMRARSMGGPQSEYLGASARSVDGSCSVDFLGGSQIPSMSDPSVLQHATTHQPTWASSDACRSPRSELDISNQLAAFAQQLLPFHIAEEEQQRRLFLGLDGAVASMSVRDGNGNEIAPLLQFQESVGLIPLEQKVDYLQAINVVPHLVLTESDPMRFLRFRDFNAQAAAWDIVRYWKERREIFRERAFLPMTITGDGALDEDSIRSWKVGYLQLLPNDAHGRTVALYRPQRRPLSDSVETSMRVSFYLGHVVSENPHTQTEGGFSSVVLIEGKPDFDPMYERAAAMFLRVFPLKFKNGHVFDVRPESSVAAFPLWFAKLIVERMGRMFLSFRMHVHLEKTKEETLQEMARHGMFRDGLPDAIGGNWTQESFERWVIDRQVFERQFYNNLDPLLAGNAVVAELLSTSGRDSSRASPQSEYSTMHGANQSDCRMKLKEEVMMLPVSERAVYLEALEQASSEVWQDEANPELFMRAENMNADLAARRLANYWQVRRELFGGKAFKSLHQTGEDALGRKDLSILATAFMKLLPNDADGCSVLWMDVSRLQKDEVSESNDRCVFYMLSLLVENPTTLDDGAVFLIKVGHSLIKKINFGFLNKLSKVLPLRFKAVHLLSHEAIPDMVKSSLAFGRDVYTHVADTREELGQALESFGLRKENLPKCLNGSWVFSKFVQWQELRTRVEWKIPLGLSGRESADEFPGIRHYTILPDEQKTERSRRLNVIHCRRKRDRVLLETALLQEQCNDLLETKSKLIRDNNELESLVNDAILHASQQDG